MVEAVSENAQEYARLLGAWRAQQEAKLRRLFPYVDFEAHDKAHGKWLYRACPTCGLPGREL